MIFMKFQQSVLLHFSELKRKPAAFHGEIIRQLLP